MELYLFESDTAAQTTGNAYGYGYEDGIVHLQIQTVQLKCVGVSVENSVERVTT